MKSLFFLAILAMPFSSYANSCFQKHINVEMPDGRVVSGELCANSVAKKDSSLIIYKPYVKVPGYFKSVRLSISSNGSLVYCQTLGLNVENPVILNSEFWELKSVLFAVSESEMRIDRLREGLLISNIICKK